MKHQFLVTVETQSGVAPQLVKDEIESHLNSLWSSIVQWVKGGKVYSVVPQEGQQGRSALVEVDFNTVLGMGGRGR